MTGSRRLTAVATVLTMTAGITMAFAHDNNRHHHHHWEKHRDEHRGDRHKHSDPGIALAAGAVALIAAAAAAKASESREVYEYHHGYGGRDNAIAACLHRANRRTVKQGGYGVSMRKVYYADHTNRGWRVSVGVRQRLASRSRKNKAICTVRRGKVTSFTWS